MGHCHSWYDRWVLLNGMCSFNLCIFVQCHQVVGLQANTDNRAHTVFNIFRAAIQTYGTPSRVRGDCGGENIDVAVWMIRHRGPNRSSFLWGQST